MEKKQEILQKIFDKIAKERELFEKGLTPEEIEEKKISNIGNEILFMVNTKDENGELKTWKIFVDGRVEGFGEKVSICNNFSFIFHRVYKYYSSLEKK